MASFAIVDFQPINSRYPALQELDVIKEIDFIAALPRNRSSSW
jgi:hypothetical protein